MKLRNFILSGFVVFLILSIILSLSVFYTYDFDVSNCNQILKNNNLATNDASIRCIKILNQPTYSYYIPGILASFGVSFFLTFFIFLFIFLFIIIHRGGFE